MHSSNLSEGAVVITDEQTAGRGQRGTVWVTSTGQNFTFSLILKPIFLPVSDQFMLSQAIALGIRQYLATYLENVWIKWPNDLYVNDLKIGGILIENSLLGAQIAQSIVGIGLNINQSNFESARATSLRLQTGRLFDLSEQLPLLLYSLERAYLRLRGGQFDALRREYLGGLLGYGKKRMFKAGKTLFEGIVVGVGATGKLQLLLPTGTLEEYDLKEIEWIWDN